MNINQVEREEQINVKSKLETSPIDSLMNKKFITSLENLGKRFFLENPMKLLKENVTAGSYQEVLMKLYAKEEEYAVEKCVEISVLCYLSTRGKVAFPISKSILERMYLNDPNWKKKLLFKEDTYKLVGQLLSDSNIIRIVMSLTSDQDLPANTPKAKYRPGVALALPGSPIFDEYTGNIDDELRELFKQYEITIDDIRESFQDSFSMWFE